MKKKLNTVILHLTGWVFFLFIPMFSATQAIKAIAPDLKNIPYLPFIIIGLFNIMVFYFNSYFLIPRYLFKKRYRGFVLRFIGFSFLCVICCKLIVILSGVKPENIEVKYPILKVLRPFADANFILMISVSILVSLVIAYYNRLKETEEAHISAQLVILKSQINPHFLFNTLNSIYATTLRTSPQAADMVARLSEMMRYTMKESQLELVALEDEMLYLSNYIALQKIRLDHSIQLEVSLESSQKGLKIAPMLLIPFVENAFKHGVNPEQKSHIRIQLNVEEGHLQLFVWNYKVNVQLETSEKSGLGMENTRRRLSLIYPNKHTLAIEDRLNDFAVSLQIDLT